MAWMEQEVIMLSEVRQAPKKQRNVDLKNTKLWLDSF